MLTRQKYLPTCLIFLIYAAATTAAQEEAEEAPAAEGEKKSFMSQFKDPEDGMLDLSQWLLDNIVGFMPVPIIITEPAVDNGVGVAGVFFHKPKDDQMKADAAGNLILPNVSAVAVAVTGNDSWLVGGGHFRNWSNDRYRYSITGGYADINLDWFGSDDFPILSDGVRFNAQGMMLGQQFLRRISESRWYLGAGWDFMNSDVAFQTSLPIELPTVENTVSGVSAIGLYENLDYRISPREGFKTLLQAKVNSDAIGSDYNFQQYSWNVRQYFEFADKYTLAWRLDGATTSGDVPFYLEPFVQIQGIPALRYQGATAATVEVRAGYDVHPRWTVLGFAGGGRTADSISDLSSAETHSAYGVGFRYQIGRAHV